MSLVNNTIILTKNKMRVQPRFELGRKFRVQRANHYPIDTLHVPCLPIRHF